LSYNNNKNYPRNQGLFHRLNLKLLRDKSLSIDKNYLLGYDKIYLLVCFKLSGATEKTIIKHSKEGKK
jgi:hypothetical protein